MTLTRCCSRKPCASRKDADRARVRLRRGPRAAAEAIRAGLVNEYQLFLAPVLVGGGKRALPDGVRFDLELLDEWRFASRFIYLRYGKRS
jgi:riboflavin biosynthesis pyrimidine reductase